jgi:hypothetical protein
MTKRSNKDHDFFVNARRVVEQAIGEQMDGTPLVAPDAGKISVRSNEVLRAFAE